VSYSFFHPISLDSQKKINESDVALVPANEACNNDDDDANRNRDGGNRAALGLGWHNWKQTRIKGFLSFGAPQQWKKDICPV